MQLLRSLYTKQIKYSSYKLFKSLEEEPYRNWVNYKIG